MDFAEISLLLREHPWLLILGPVTLLIAFVMVVRSFVSLMHRAIDGMLGQHQDTTRQIVAAFREESSQDRLSLVQLFNQHELQDQRRHEESESRAATRHAEVMARLSDPKALPPLKGEKRNPGVTITTMKENAFVVCLTCKS